MTPPRNTVLHVYHGEAPFVPDRSYLDWRGALITDGYITGHVEKGFKAVLFTTGLIVMEIQKGDHHYG